MEIELINNKLINVKLLVLDVDGTMTDGTVYYGAEGEALKRFSIRDGMGIELLKKSGLKIAILTSENSNIVKSRTCKLSIDDLILGSRNKKRSLNEIAERMNISLSEIAYMGDDINDFFAIKIAGVSACPKDSHEIIKNEVDYICNKKGGKGAVREFIEMILNSQNKSINLNEDW